MGSWFLSIVCQKILPPPKFQPFICKIKLQKLARSFILDSPFKLFNIMSQDPSQTLPKVDSRSKKGDILSAYGELLKKIQDNAEGATDRRKASTREQDEEVIEQASRFSVKNVLDGISKLETDIRKNLADLAEALVQEVQKFKQMEEAIKVEKKRLSEIHAIQVEADTLVQLIQAHKQKKLQLEEDIEAKQEEWKREQAAYVYDLELKRRKEEEEYQAKRRVKEQELLERENRIKELDQEFKELKIRCAGFDQMLQEAVERASQEAREQAITEEGVKAKLLAENTAAEKRIADITITSLKERLDEQEAEIKRLKVALAEAQEGVKDIAVKVIESTAHLEDRYRFVKTFEGEKVSKEEKTV